MSFLSGGPSHQDMYDLKMDAPSEIRGTFRPIDTNVCNATIPDHAGCPQYLLDHRDVIREPV